MERPVPLLRRRRSLRGGLLGMLMAVALTAMGCSGAPSSAPASTTPTTARPGAAAYVWLRDRAEPWNRALNADEGAVLAAGRAVNETSAGTYFSRLRSACTAMLEDTRKAQSIVHAPVAPLDQAWQGMLTTTEAYASDCVTLVRSHADQDLTAWNNSLASMNAASGAWNTAVAATRAGAHPSAG